jgi:pantetheine-phosphate adenylyltransferase
MKALISGTFDPITLGHLDIIERAASMFDSVTVAICVNGDKSSKFTLEQRKEMANLACAHIKNVKIDVCDGLLAAYTEKNGISVIVRGVRDANDVPYEISLSTINRSLHNHPDTIFIPSKPEYTHISSSYVREMIKYGESLKNALPEAVIDYISKKNLLKS